MSSNLVDLPTSDKGKKSEMVTMTMLITPEQAQCWLDAMPHQRWVRQNKIRMLSRQMLEGRWKLTPNGLAINPSGHVIDGQHRLMVIAQTGKSVMMRVTFNAPDDSFLVIDGGTSPKNLDDALRHHGVSRAISAIIGGAVRMLFREERDTSVWDNTLQCSNEEGIDVFRANPGIVPACELASRCRLAPSRASLGYFLYRGTEINEARTTKFAEGLITGELLVRGDPALLLRKTWIQERTARVSPTLLHDGIRIATAINAALKGRKLGSWGGVDFGKGKTPAIGW